ncbi:MAG: hybrid sensor histidine kinase/response regulator [Deltaproteobacteria bacterium]|nr:hybrid sensor histidine kinase/response regulator [Kofleriaceae bacterium]
MAGDADAILVVDDRAQDLFAISTVLDGAGCQVVTASTGGEALRRVLERDFALILLDVHLPDIDGFEVAAMIKQRERSKHTPIIMLTAAGSDRELIYRGYSVGAVDYMAKPLDAAILRGKVAIFLDLFRKDRRIAEQAAALRTADRRERELEMAAVRLEHQRQVAEAAHAAVHARDEFLSIASHELRTPLMTLQLRLDTLAEALEREACDADTCGMLESAIRQADRLVSLVDGMLDVSRITSGRLTLQVDMFDLRDAVTEVADRFREAATRAGCALAVAAHEPIVGVWDRLRIEQILSNLLGNAIKYAPHGPVEVDAVRRGELVLVTVRDHGGGIAPEDVERVFGQFERAVTTRHLGGLGMGLYIARQIAIAHGGTIHCDSLPGQGAAFVLELPSRVPGVGLEPTLP